MIKNLIILVAFSLSVTAVHAQKKSELIEEIGILKVKISALDDELAVSKKNERVSKTEAESYKAQADELLETNQSLMKNINSFTKASIEKSDNIGKTLETLRSKEAQLKKISDAFSTHDSIALLVLTDFKKSLGENANISVASGAVIVSLNETVRTGIATNEESAIAYLGKIATVINMHTNSEISVETLTNTGEFDVALTQAATVAGILQKQFTVDASRISVNAKDGGFSEGLTIKVMPKFDSFYFALREQMKEANK
ncbi:hypothetical protein KO500_08190 [Cellulophaga baltica]|uniref:hypothetical protein n=1 Tax=Cellulophaga TaxID=104264 RepID=UPI001C06ACEB|nr:MULTISPECIES: hypothetical protein [Cellulophaga]MBU2996411.1 hypothetical protein [Cellulophaga baltica]MDO6767807.1 hypothetical protein [Cellulophaga sp. 1_MG-2023]